MNILSNIYARIRHNNFTYILIVVFILGSFSIWLNLSSMKISDPDGFYHIRHAWLYRTQGIFDTSFPWVEYSVIKKYGGDLWYGFHLFLIPFTYFSDLIIGIKFSSAAITFTCLLLYFFAFHRLHLKFSLFWALFLPFTNDYMLARLTVTRPHPLSIGLNIYLFSLLLRGGIWPVFFVSFLFSFIHLNLFWIPLLTLAIISIGRKLNGRSLEIKKAIALVSGIFVGAFLKPNPISALKINYIQLVDITLVKIQKIRLAFGNELNPIQLRDLPSHLLLLFIIMALFFIWLVYKKNLAKTSLETKIAMWTLLLLTTMFLLLTLFVAGRAMDFLMSYFLMFTALNITFYLDKIKEQRDQLGSYGYSSIKHDLIKGIVVGGIIIFIAGYNLVKFCQYRYDPSDSYIYRFENTGKWLELNTKPGAIVFNSRWDMFPELFFWNWHNHYINGMDPIFMYKYNPGLYWEYHFLNIGPGGEYTCSNRKCDKNTAIKTYDVLTDHFKASYIVIWPLANEELFRYLGTNPDKFERVFTSYSDIVYKIKPKPVKKL